MKKVVLYTLLSLIIFTNFSLADDISSENLLEQERLLQEQGVPNSKSLDQLFSNTPSQPLSSETGTFQAISKDLSDLAPLV